MPLVVDKKESVVVKNKKRVAHYKDEFFVRSETFIYNTIRQSLKTEPVLITHQISNLDEFPYEVSDLYNIRRRKYTHQWFYEGIVKRLTGRLLAAEKICRQRQVQLIHAHFGPNGYEALALKRRLGLPLITNFYGYDMSLLARQPKWQSRYQTLFKGGDRFLVEGTFMKKQLSDLGCPTEKIDIQKIGIQLDPIPFRIRKPKGENEKVIILFCGRLVEKKGLMTALAAIRQAWNVVKNFEFHIIGEGSLQNQMDQYIAKHEMASYVKCLGFLDYAQYLKKLGESDLFLHPSVTSEEGDSEGGAPTSLLEAQASGLPIIATMHADIPNVVVPNKSALLSKEYDQDALAENIIFFLNNQESWEAFGQAGRSFVEQNHDIKRTVDELEKIYGSLE